MIRICLVGPESTGKTTLARDLAAHFKAPYIREYAADYIAGLNRDLIIDDLDVMLKEQLRQEDAVFSHNSAPCVFCDSDAMTTRLWSEVLFGRVSDFVSKAERAAHKRYDHTLLLSPDVAWVDDAHRIDQNGREAFFVRCEEGLIKAVRSYSVISGDWTNRYEKACKAIQDRIG